MIGLTLRLGILAGSNVALSFLYQWYVFAMLGANRATDAFFAGTTIPQMVLGIIANTFPYVLIPLLAVRRGDAFRRDTWTMLQAVIGLFGVLAALLALLAPFWVRAIVPGFDPAAVALTVHLTRIQLLGMVLTAASGVLSAASQARERFLRAESAPLIAGLLGFPVLVLGLHRYGIVAAAWTQVLRLALQFLVLLPMAGRYRLPALRSEVIRIALRRLRPLLLGGSYTKLEMVLDRVLSSLAPAGALSLLNLSAQVYAGGAQVVNSAIAAPVVPAITQAAARDDWTTYREHLRQRLTWMLLVTGSAVALAALLGRPAIAFIFHRFEPSEVRTVWLLILCMGGVGVGAATGQVLAMAFYAVGDTGTPVRVNVFCFTLGAGLKIAGFLLFGVLGIAAAASVQSLLQAGILGARLWRVTPAAPLPAPGRGEAASAWT